MSRVYHRVQVTFVIKGMRCRECIIEVHVTFVIKGMRCREYLILNGDLISFIYKPNGDCVYM